ncbi:hypothetical protein Mal4_06460 [Maioricimonas rarisocia]|uniref:Uncharacterized protein n=1 Tax=Maioricimonas rarisocia TaxID=2528026 RepID=A0A517Z1K2_9PLAN|nr:hypothetical protein Mal4_06460 [Maioricimonas rarisocia]
MEGTVHTRPCRTRCGTCSGECADARRLIGDGEAAAPLRRPTSVLARSTRDERRQQLECAGERPSNGRKSPGPSCVRESSLAVPAGTAPCRHGRKCSHAAPIPIRESTPTRGPHHRRANGKVYHSNSRSPPVNSEIRACQIIAVPGLQKKRDRNAARRSRCHRTTVCNLNRSPQATQRLRFSIPLLSLRIVPVDSRPSGTWDKER